MATHTYRGHQFAIERHGRWSYFCHGVKRPRDPDQDYWFDPDGEWDTVALCHEAGWGSRSYEKCLKRVQKSIDKRIAEDVEQRRAAWPAGLVNR